MRVMDCAGVLSRLVTKAAEPLCAVADDSDAPTVYDAKCIVGVTMLQYLERWVSHTGVQGESIIIAACLIDRLLERTGLRLSLYNMHRVVLAALVVTDKSLSDTPFSNTAYASVGGVTLQELNRLERAFLSHIEFDVHVTTATYRTYLRNCVRAQRQHEAEVSERFAVEALAEVGQKKAALRSAAGPVPAAKAAALALPQHELVRVGY